MPDPVYIDEGDSDFKGVLVSFLHGYATPVPADAVITGHVGPWTEPSDVFRLELTERTGLLVTLDGLERNADLVVRNAQGQTVAFRTTPGTEPEQIAISLDPGIWYVAVLNAGGLTPYRLTLASTLPVDGTLGNDSLLGTDGPDSLYGLFGDDTLDAGKGPDLLVGSAGHDVLFGGWGSDTLYGGPGDDLLEGGGGEDTLYGEWGNDTLSGGNGADRLFGGDGDDLIEIGLTGAYLWSYPRDYAYGGSGNDTLIGAGGRGWLDGGAGDDLIDGRGGEVLRLIGGEGDDTLYAADVPGATLGDAGRDLLYGGAGKDALNGGTGNDTLHGNDGADYLGMGAGNDMAYGGAGDDTLYAGDGFDTLWGGAGADRFEFWRNKDVNRIEDFDASEGDVIALAASNWMSDHGILRPLEIVTLFGRINPDGDAVLDFGNGGTVIVLVDVPTLDGLVDSIVVI
ncbi:MAG: hypothetical protein LPK12_17660 [Rhodobacterales bacterium]|nr:hypothetical protein [Rhodobacterales bacterium]MDX5501766.1 hypothetical protein [Rhodobacterales bacterium]